MNRITVTLSTPIGGELGSISGEVDQIKDTIINWLETAADGDTLTVKSEEADLGENVIAFRPRWGDEYDA